MLTRILNTDNSPAQFFIRIALGVVIFPHGAQKLFGLFGGPGIEKTLQIFGNMGFPAWAVILLVIFETFGAFGLIIGFFSRIWALGIGIALSICMYMNHIQHGFFMNWYGNQKGEGFEFHLLAIGICLALVIRGSGWLSADRKLTR